MAWGGGDPSIDRMTLFIVIHVVIHIAHIDKVNLSLNYQIKDKKKWNLFQYILIYYYEEDKHYTGYFSFKS